MEWMVLNTMVLLEGTVAKEPETRHQHRDAEAPLGSVVHEGEELLLPWSFLPQAQDKFGHNRIKANILNKESG